jgi:hypothetical protein
MSKSRRVEEYARYAHGSPQPAKWEGEGEGERSEKVRLAFPFISFVNRIMGPRQLVFVFLSLRGINSEKRYPNAIVTYNNVFIVSISVSRVRLP